MTEKNLLAMNDPQRSHGLNEFAGLVDSLDIGLKAYVTLEPYLISLSCMAKNFDLKIGHYPVMLKRVC